MAPRVAEASDWSEEEVAEHRMVESVVDPEEGREDVLSLVQPIRGVEEAEGLAGMVE